MSDPTKKTIDGLFDKFDSFLDKANQAMAPASPKQEEPQDDTTSARWENQFEEVMWAPVKTNTEIHQWHAFRQGSQSPICDSNLAFKSHQIEERRVLPHGKTITACTSCIIGASK